MTLRCFDGLLTAGHLYPIGDSWACLLRSILAAGDGFGSHLGGLGDILGMGWVPDWPGDRPMGWIALAPGREGRPKARVIWSFWALLSIKQLPDSRNVHLRTA